MDKRKALRLAIMIACVAAAVCAISIIGFRQNAAASKAAARRPITPVLASYVRPQASSAARLAAGAVPVSRAVSSQAGEAPDDALAGIPSHKRYAIIGEDYLPAGEDAVPMGVLKAEGQ